MGWMIGDGMAMEIDLNGPVMERLVQVGTDFMTGWKAAEDQIASLAAQLGNDPMGRAFRSDFDPAAEQIAGVVSLLAERVERRGRAGRDLVAIYEATNELATQAIRDATRASQL
jgi:hypothetical protein